MELDQNIEWTEWENRAKKNGEKWVKLIIGGFFLIIYTVFVVWISSSNSGEGVTSLNTGRNTRKKGSQVSGEFTLPNLDEQEREENRWLERHVFQPDLRNSLGRWINLIKYSPRYQPFGVLVENRHALFYGPPGSGKSWFAKLLGEKESLAYTFADFVGNEFHGSNQRKIDETFRQAKRILASERNPTNKPVMIFVDEVDSIAAKNFSSPNNSIATRENNDFLNFINVINDKNYNIIVIGITNYPEELERAMTRSGRLGSKKFKFSLLTEAEVGAATKSLQEEAEGDERGCYRCLGNKKLRENDTMNEQYRVVWAANFWAEVEELNREIINQYRTKKVSFTLAELRQALEEAIGLKISKDSGEISPTSDDYRQELTKIMEGKLENYGKTSAREPAHNSFNGVEMLKNLSLNQIDEFLTYLTKEKAEREREREQNLS